MPASSATPAARKALAALLVLCGILSAQAAEPPDNVEAEVTDAVQSCKDLEGTPNADAVLNVDDLNGDGGEDWIVDYAKLKCEGGINRMCGADGCTLQIFLWDGGTAWNLAFEEPVQSYKFAKVRGKRVLQAVMAGAACGKPSNKTCNLTFRLDKTAIVPIQKDEPGPARNACSSSVDARPRIAFRCGNRPKRSTTA